MYRKVETRSTSVGSWGKPVATLKDNHGGISHFVVDDGCYVLLNLVPTHRPSNDRKFKPSAWIYPEAFEVLKTLPSLLTTAFSRDANGKVIIKDKTGKIVGAQG